VQVLTKEYYALQTSMEKRISELETIITEKTVRLESYEKLEHELDEVVMQAADSKCYCLCLLFT
jgi:progesterone-induced-blocking factor 1